MIKTTISDVLVALLIGCNLRNDMTEALSKAKFTQDSIPNLFCLENDQLGQVCRVKKSDSTSYLKLFLPYQISEQDTIINEFNPVTDGVFRTWAHLNLGVQLNYTNFGSFTSLIFNEEKSIMIRDSIYSVDSNSVVSVMHNKKEVLRITAIPSLSFLNRISGVQLNNSDKEKLELRVYLDYSKNVEMQKALEETREKILNKIQDY